MPQASSDPAHSKLRRQIAYEAAMLLYQRHESEYYRAKMKAARRVCKGWVKPADLPSNAEIRDQVFSLTRTFESETHADELQEMRVEAMRMMRLLANFKPKLIGSVLTGHIRRGSDIDLHVFCNSPSAVATVLEQEGLVFDAERKVVTKHGETRTYHHLHVRDRFPTELTIYPANKSGYAFKSSVTGKTMESATLP
ncbi:MAG: tRNA adenylyltransferase, partial [Planctomycetota bacterium]